MMKGVLNVTGIVFGSLLGVFLLAGVALYLMGNTRRKRTYESEPASPTFPSDARNIEFGRHGAQTLYQGSHGEDMRGAVNFFDGGPLATRASANVTPSTCSRSPSYCNLLPEINGPPTGSPDSLLPRVEPVGTDTVELSL